MSVCLVLFLSKVGCIYSFIVRLGFLFVVGLVLVLSIVVVSFIF